MTHARQAALAALLVLCLMVADTVLGLGLGADATPARAYWLTRTVG